VNSKLQQAGLPTLDTNRKDAPSEDADEGDEP